MRSTRMSVFETTLVVSGEPSGPLLELIFPYLVVCENSLRIDADSYN
jgi:hypothetical protein